MSPPAAAMAGLDALIASLRQAALQVPIGTSEAIDAARLLAHMAAQAAQSGAGEPSLAQLRLRLRPVLCKAAADLPLFDTAFDDWEKAVLAARGQPVVDPDAGSATGPGQAAGQGAGGDATTGTTTGTNTGTNTGTTTTTTTGTDGLRPPLWRQGWFQALAGALVLVVLVVLLLATGTPEQQAARPQPASAPRVVTAAPSAPQAGPVAPLPQPAPSAARPVDGGLPAIRGVTPAWRAHDSLRWPWLLLLLGLPLLGLLPLLGVPPPLPYISRQRGAGSLTLEAWPPHKQRRQLVRDIAPATSGQLQRHVRGAVDQREAYARRPQLDLRRTVNASLVRGGLLQLHHRFARLRPAYLVLVQAQQDDDLGVLWARRLAELDVRAAIFRFHQDGPGLEPACVEVGGLGRRLPFSALPAPWPEQRLVVIGRCSALLGRDGRPHPWVLKARLGRWAQRVLFHPDEPRDWPRRQVQALEATRDGGLGMQVLPFEDNALDAWSDWLVRGTLPPITLEAPQGYPRLLKQGEARFCGDSQPADLDPDPAQAEQLAQQLVTQLQAYLGQNGFYWLCACAVPPLLEQRLAQLLGEEYFRRCGASEAAVATYMARNWRLLVRLPWLRPQPQPLPQWLRLALLARLPPAIQDELREVVRGALGRRAAATGAGGAAGGGLALAFDAPDAPPQPGAPRVDDPRHALLVGFVQDGLDARELMLRLPGAWQQWLPALQQRRGPGGARALARGSTALARGWRRLRRADAATRAAAWRWALAGALLAGSALAVLPTLPASAWPAPLRALLFEPQALGLAVRSLGDSVALAPSGQRALLFDPRNWRLLDTATGRALASDRTVDEPVAAQFSADGSQVVLAYGPAVNGPILADEDTPRQVVVVSADLRRRVVAIERLLADPATPPQVAPSPDNRQLLLMHRADPANAKAGDVLSVQDARPDGLRANVLLPAGSRPLAWAWGPDGTQVVTMAARPDGGLWRITTALGNSTQDGQPDASLLAVKADDFLALSPDGMHWLARVGTQLRLFSAADPLAQPGVVVADQPVAWARFAGDGRHLLLGLGGADRGQAVVLRTTDQPLPLSATPADLPPGTRFLPDASPAASDASPSPLAVAGLVAALALLAAIAGTAWGWPRPDATRRVPA